MPSRYFIQHASWQRGMEEIVGAGRLLLRWSCQSEWLAGWCARGNEVFLQTQRKPRAHLDHEVWPSGTPTLLYDSELVNFQIAITLTPSWTSIGSILTKGLWEMYSKRPFFCSLGSARCDTGMEGNFTGLESHNTDILFKPPGTL